MDKLRLLQREARSLFRVEDYVNRSIDGIEQYFVDFHREVDLDPVRSVLAEGMQRFQGMSDKSDGWFAPRIHDALRLYRSEAADSRLWEYLTFTVARDYVAWRWVNDGGIITTNRVLGPDRRNAIGRLWWLAELARNGSNYAPVVDAAMLQETINTITDVDFSQNRAAAQAYIRFMQSENNGNRGNLHAQKYRKGLNFLLTTFALDIAAPDINYPDLNSVSDWIDEGPNVFAYFDKLPEGPDEPVVNEKYIGSVTNLLRQLDPPVV